MRNTKNKLGRNITFQLINQIVILVTPLITTPYLSRVLGPTELGRYSYAQSMAYYFYIFSTLGMSVYGSRQIARVKDKKDELEKIFSSLFWLRAFISVILLGCYLTLVLCKIINPADTIISVIMGFYVCSAMIDVRWLFQGLEHFHITVTRSIIIKLISIIAIFLFVNDQNDTMVYVFIYAFFTMFLNEAVLLFLTPQYVRLRRPKLSAIFPEIGPVFVMFIPYIANLILRHIDKVMLGSMSTLAQVGFYENTDKIYIVLTVIAASVGDVLMPRVTNLIANNKEKETARMLTNAMKLCIVSSCALAFGIAGIADDFIPVFLGNDFSECIVLVKLISPTIVMLSFSNIIRKAYIIPKYKMRVFCTATLSAVAVNIILNYFLIPMYAAKGAVIATIVAEFIVIFVQICFLFRELEYVRYFKDLFVYCVIGGIMYASVKVVSEFAIKSFVLIGAEILVGILIYVTLSTIWMVITKDDLLVCAMSIIEKKHLNIDKSQ